MENLGIDVKLLVAQIINFLLFLLVFKVFFAKPFAKFIGGEEKKTQEREKLLADVKAQEEEFAQKEAAFKKKMKQQEDALLKKTKEDALLVKEELVSEAREEAKEIVDKAKQEIMEEREEMREEMKKKVGELSLILVSEALEDALDKEAKKKVTTYILTNLDKRSIQNEN